MKTRSQKPFSLVSLIIAATLLSGCGTSFKRDPLPEPLYVPNIVLGEEQVLTILAGRVPCDSAMPMQCVLARQQNSSELFQIPYAWIEGFSPVATTEYVIKVRPKIDANKQAMTGHWTLTQVLEQTNRR